MDFFNHLWRTQPVALSLHWEKNPNCSILIFNVSHAIGWIMCLRVEQKTCHFEKSLPRYAGYSDFPPTLLTNEENNWASPSSHDGAVTVPASLPATRGTQGMRSTSKKFKNSESSHSPEGTWHQGWLSSCRDHAATATGCTISNTPTHLAPAQGENRFSQNLQCDL